MELNNVGQSFSCVQLFETPWTVSMPVSSVLHCLPRFAQIHVPSGSVGREPTCNAGDAGSIPWTEKPGRLSLFTELHVTEQKHKDVYVGDIMYSV